MHQHGVVVEEVKQLRARVAELEQELQEVKQAADGRRDLDELTRAVIATAQRASRELREAARHEAETTLRKAHRREVDLERQLADRRKRALKEIAALEATRSCLYEEMQSALESLKSALVEQEQGPEDQPESTAFRGPAARLVP